MNRQFPFISSAADDQPRNGIWSVLLTGVLAVSCVSCYRDKDVDKPVPVKKTSQDQSSASLQRLEVATASKQPLADSSSVQKTSPRLTEAQALSQSGKWEDARTDLYKVWGAEDPFAAIQHALENNPGASTACVSAILQGWSQKSPVEAIAWAETNGGSAERSLWLATLATTVPADQLERLGTAVISVLEKPSGTQALTSYANRLLSENGDAAFGWMERSISSPVLMSQVSRQVMDLWVSRDIESAAQWLMKAPASASWRDGAVTSLVVAAAAEDPGAAQQWARTLTNQESREALLSWLDKHKVP